MKNIVFATNNKNKLQEIRAIAGGEYNILSLSEIGCHDDIPETAATIEGNAMLKARWVIFSCLCLRVYENISLTN